MMNKEGILIVGANHRSSTLRMRRRMLPQGADSLWLLRAALKEDIKPVMAVVSEESIALMGTAQTACDAMNRGMLMMSLLSRQESYAREGLFSLWGREALRYLFSLASGFESLEGADNVRSFADGVHHARRTQSLAPPLSSAVEYAVQLGERLREQSPPASLAGVALEMCHEVHGKDEPLTVLLLESSPLASLIVRGMTHNMRERLEATHLEATPPFDAWQEKCSRADVVLISRKYDFAINADFLREVMRSRKGRPLLMIDCAAPGALEPSAYELDGVYCFDVSDLEERLLRKGHRRAHFMGVRRDLIAHAVRDFMGEGEARERKHQDMRADELFAHHLRRLYAMGGLEEVLAHPSRQLAQLERDGKADEARALMRFLFEDEAMTAKTKQDKNDNK